MAATLATPTSPPVGGAHRASHRRSWQSLGLQAPPRPSKSPVSLPTSRLRALPARLPCPLGVPSFLIEASLEIDETGGGARFSTTVALGTTPWTISPATRFPRRTSKRRAYRASLLAAIAPSAPRVRGLPPWDFAEAQLVIAMVLVGLPIAGNYLFPAPSTADIIDYDTLETGLRREAMYYGAQNFVEKTTSVSAAILGVLLTFGKTTEDPLGIRLAGPVAAVLVLVGYLAQALRPPRRRARRRRYAEASASR